MNVGLPFTVLMLVATACSTTVLSLDVGTCFHDGDAITDQRSEVTDVPVVDCGGPHDNEVYSTYQMADGVYPGEERVYDTADSECLASFEDYVGTSFEASQLDFGWLAPTQQTWDEANDREVICFLYDRDFAKLTGSMRSAGI
jgi:hypothetical protein